MTDRTIAPAPVFVITEAGVNHNGSLDLALQLVDVAAEAGADAVKFQTFRADKLVTHAAPKAAYQTRTTAGGESQYEMIKRLELDAEMHRALIERCGERKLEFMSTPFDVVSVDMLARTFDLARIKISSGDLTNGPLLLAAARTGKPVILSTGMATLAEIREALGVLAFGYTQAGAPPSRRAFAQAFASAAGREAVRERVCVLHCTTEYPAPLEEVNLRAMVAMREALGVTVGYSDHTRGINVPVAAVALGARVIEKHFTLDRDLPGPDHAASLEPDELVAMVRAIREVETALGCPEKGPSPSEMKNMTVARKSLVAATPIVTGEAFSEANLDVKRPGTGASPMDYWNRLGRTAARDYAADEVIE